MRENIWCNSSALGYVRSCFEICETLCDICPWDFMTLLKRGLALRHCFVLVYRVVLRLYESSELYLEIPEIITMILLLFLKQDAEKTDDACLNVQMVAVVQMNFLLTSAWRNLISSLQFVFYFTVDVIANWDANYLILQCSLMWDILFLLIYKSVSGEWCIGLVCLVRLRDLGLLVSEGFCDSAWPKS